MPPQMDYFTVFQDLVLIALFGGAMVWFCRLAEPARFLWLFSWWAGAGGLSGRAGRPAGRIAMLYRGTPACTGPALCRGTACTLTAPTPCVSSGFAGSPGHLALTSFK